jgi:uncharacterized protein (UPF0332 family)
MPPPDPVHLFEQADALAGNATEEPRQVDLRRAISAAYYGLFHFTLTAAADMMIGTGHQSTRRYELVYRSVDHSRLMTLCRQLSGSKPASPIEPYAPSDGFGSVASFARIVCELYELREFADYDPLRDFTVDEAKIAVRNAREAIEWFKGGTDAQREAFLTLVLFRPREQFLAPRSSRR